MSVLRQFGFNEARINEALESIYSTVILRDVMEHNKVVDQTLVLFLCGNIGSITSPNNIGNVLSNEGDIVRTKKKPGKILLAKPLINIFVYFVVPLSSIKRRGLM